MVRSRRSRNGSRSWWESASDRDLLDLRLRDLGLDWRDTWLADRVEQLHGELEARGLRLRPHVWLSTEWFSPDGIPGIAIPFFLAHERLMRLEKRMMLAVEGSSDRECMKLLRHEAGHAACTAYRLHRRPRWRDTFGPYGKPYPDSYVPRARSRNHVQHLRGWYAQAHPAEDFAETFAVWLAPNSRWRSRYRGWPALQKLEVVDSMMDSIAGRPTKVRSRRHVEPVSRSSMTLREYYEQKHERYGASFPSIFDEDLLVLFSSDHHFRRRPTAASFLRRARPHIRDVVGRWTGEVAYTVDHVIVDMINRCRELELRLTLSESKTFHEASVLVAVHTTRTIHRTPHRIML